MVNAAAQADLPWETLTYPDLAEVFQNFSARRQAIQDTVEIRVKGGPNSLTAKTLLRYYQANRDIEMAASLSNELFLGKEISIFQKDPETGQTKEVHHFVFGGGDICDKFNACPWFLDTLFDFAQAILIKKLMPPSLVFGTRESGSAESESPTTPTA